MEAPDRIYLSEEPFKDGNSEICWNYNPPIGGIEYIYIDYFIEKAVKWLDKELPVTDLSSSNLFDLKFKVLDKESKRVFIEDFRNYMKGE